MLGCQQAQPRKEGGKKNIFSLLSFALLYRKCVLKRTVLESNLFHPFISGPETSGKMFLSVKVRGEARPGAKGRPAQTGAPLWFATFLWPRKKNNNQTFLRLFTFSTAWVSPDRGRIDFPQWKVEVFKSCLANSANISSEICIY